MRVRSVLLHAAAAMLLVTGAIGAEAPSAPAPSVPAAAPAATGGLIAPGRSP